MNGADLLCRTLLGNGIDVCFSNPGTSEMHFVAALDRIPEIRCILGLSENVVTAAADGYARMADKPAATLLHLGPGLANGLSNLHNARRAFMPVVNVVGDHTTPHLPHDAPLTSDIESLARPMSQWVHRTTTADDVGRDAASAIAAAMSWPRQVATLILPADAAWGETREAAPPASLASPAEPDSQRISAAARLLANGKTTTILLSGMALRAPALDVASRIAQKTGARLMAQQSNARMERGAGRVAISRVPYNVDEALAAFATTEQVILIGAKAPVAFFAYPGKPGSMLPPDCAVFEMAGREVDLCAALSALAEVVGATALVPARVSLKRPSLPQGALTPDAIFQALTALMPENAIICDESVSSGRNLFAQTAGAPPHDFLQLTGGSIGWGLGHAVGASVACPDRKVIVLQADGSGMYINQALWTQAREGLDVVSIVFANRKYAILHGEFKHVGAGAPGRNASRMLNLDQPAIDWVSLARGMGVNGQRAETAESFAKLLAHALSTPGPHLIEAVI
jgi:acetolactate synthase-1/2/3 large subunit